MRLNSLSGRQDLGAMLLFFVVAFSLLAFPYSFVSRDSATLNSLSLDEWSFLEFMNSSVYPQIFSFNPKVVFLRDNWGYGSIYYLVYAWLTAGIATSGNYTWTIFSLRYVSIGFLALTMFTLYKISRLRNGFVWSIVGGISMLLFPGFHFFYKPFSVEMITLFGISLTTYYMLKDGMKFRGEIVVSAYFLGMTLGLKLSAITLIPAMFLYFLILDAQKLLQLKIEKVLKLVASVTAGFVIANPYFVTPGGVAHYRQMFRQNLESNRTAHGYDATRANFVTWFLDIVTREYVGIFVSVWVLVVLGVFVYRDIAQRVSFSIILFASILLIIHYVYVSNFVKTMYYWYLYPAFLLVPGSMVRGGSRYTGLVSICTICALLLSNIDGIVTKHRGWINLEMDSKFLANKLSGREILAFINDQFDSPRRILKTAYLYLETSSLHPSSRVFIEWGYLNEKMLEETSPDMILYQKYYGVYTPDSISEKWTSRPKLLAGRQLIQDLEKKGVSINGTEYRYKRVYETSDAVVFERIYDK